MTGLVPFNKNKGTLKTQGFDDFYNMLDNFFEDTWEPMKRFQCGTFKLDVQENEKEYIIEAEVPGTKKEEIKLEMNDNKLEISIEKDDQVEDVKKNFVHRERRVCSMQRSIYLKNAKADSIKAKLDDGVLTITVPKDEKKLTNQSISIE